MRAALLTFLLVLLPAAAAPQTKRVIKKPAATKAKATPTKKSQAKSAQAPVDELTRLREEYVKATNEYKELLKKQLAGFENNVAKAEDRLTRNRNSSSRMA